MDRIEIREHDEIYSFYHKNTYLGSMNATQIGLFYVVYKTKKANDDKEVKKLYCKALSLTSWEFEEVINEVTLKFSVLFRYNIDFTKIDFSKVLSGFEQNISIGRIRAFTPTTIAIGLTNRCFCQCKYCYAKECGKIITNETIYELDIETLQNIFKYANFAGIKTISLTGGDPLAYSDFWSVLELCKEFDLRVNFSTKKILTENDIDKILWYKEQIDYIQFSIDSLYVCEEKHMLDFPRCDKALPALRMFVERCNGKITVSINSVLTKYNIDNILDLSNALASLGNIKHSLSPYTFNFSTNNQDFFPSREQYQVLKNKIDAFPNKDMLSYSIVIAEEKCEDKTVICRAGINALIINYDGNVYACERFCADKNFALGNIHQQSLTEIWNSSKIYQYSNPDRSLFSQSQCGTCPDFDYCAKSRGICYVHSYILNNMNIYAPDSFCKFKNASDDTIRIY